jgi:hypothetical protein
VRFVFFIERPLVPICVTTVAYGTANRSLPKFRPDRAGKSF